MSGLTDFHAEVARLFFSVPASDGSNVGPTFDPEGLTGRKLIALYDRAEARDFADVYVLIERAAEIDAGLDPGVLAAMLRTLARFDDDEIPVESGDVAELRAFFIAWSSELDRAADDRSVADESRAQP